MTVTGEQRVSFYQKIDRNGPIQIHCPELGPCHVWTAGKTASGYGKVGIGCAGARSTQLAHRVAFYLEHGRWPAPCCLHRCDNPACVNPAHLFEGDHADNVADKVAKGRTPKGDGHFARLKPHLLPRGSNNGARLHPESYRGERNAMSKLTEQQVRDIRANYALCRVTQAALAKRFGVSPQAISKVITGKRWAQCL